MPHGVSIPKEELERVMDAAEEARVVVAVEQAYDVIDEMSSNPDKFFDSLEKLSRLARKVLNDIKDELKYVDETLKKLEEGPEKRAGEEKERFQREKEEVEKKKRDLNAAYNRLMDWSRRCRELTEILMGKDPASRREIVKIFATLAVAPDWFSERIAEILKG
ncbi:hypothetical protein [Thermofilum sp.]|uniref:hypothetical protein n=1 Tax=Thermofilum sp. TaxID=1961369 RepID=UPI00315FB823